MNLGNLVAALRRCTRCKCWKPPEDFYSLRNGLQSRCKRCTIECRAAYRMEQRKKAGTHDGLVPEAQRFAQLRFTQ